MKKLFTAFIAAVMLLTAVLFVACDSEDKKYFKTVSAYSFFVLG